MRKEVSLGTTGLRALLGEALCLGKNEELGLVHIITLSQVGLKPFAAKLLPKQDVVPVYLIVLSASPWACPISPWD